MFGFSGPSPSRGKLYDEFKKKSSIIDHICSTKDMKRVTSRMIVV